MEGLVEFKTGDGAVIAVEAADDVAGSRLVSRDGTVQAARTFEGALDGVRSAAEAALRVFRDGALQPDGVEIEFGVKLSAETGAIIAKGAPEGHLVVKHLDTGHPMSGAEWHARVECSGKCEPLMPDTACLLRAL